MKNFHKYIFVLLLTSILISKTQSQISGKSNNLKMGLVDIKIKTENAEKLVNKAVEYFKKAETKLPSACLNFRKSLGWRLGELAIFVFDDAGACLVHGDDTSVIWKNFKDYKTPEDKSLISEMLSKDENGGWLTYNWNNGFMSSYVKTVTKDNKKYIIGTGFFPEHREYIVEQLVKSAVSRFNSNPETGKKESFDLIDNQLGPFVKGDIYLFAYDFEGNNVAHGENIAYRGQNLLGLVDSRGNKIIQAMIDIAKKPEGTGWLDYVWAGIPKRGYVHRVIDPKTKTPYFIGAGYYPEVDEDYTKSFVGEAIKFLKSNGKDDSVPVFNSIVGKFARGGLKIEMYDLDGNVIANGDNPGFVGQNLIKRKDEAGREITALMIEEAKKNGRGWITSLNKNAYMQTYFEKVEVPDGIFIIASGFYPASKQQSVKALVEKSIITLKSLSSYDAFKQFSSPQGEFLRGDLKIVVYDTQATCYVNGDNNSAIWKNLKSNKDLEGRKVIDNIIATGSAGGGWVEYKVNNATRRVYVKGVDKNMRGEERKTYIIGCGYFL